MDESAHNYIVRNIQAAHRSQIEHILQQLNKGSIDGAKKYLPNALGYLQQKE